MENLKNVEMMALEFGNDLGKVQQKLKNLSSNKTNWNKKKFHPNYEEKMTEILAEIELMNQVKRLIEGQPRKTWLTLTDEEISQLDYEESRKASESCQSKMSRSRWLTPEEGDNDEYRHAEKMWNKYKDHMSKVKPLVDGTIRKSEVQNVIDLIEMNPDLSNERILDLLKNLVK